MRIFEKATQVQIVDERFYDVGADDKNERIYYPSVTTILDCYPKGAAFIEWVKSVGHNAEIVASIAAEKGSYVHNAISLLLKGEELTFNDEVKGEYKYHGNKIGLDEWKAILKFKQFYSEYVEKTIAVEMQIVSHEFKYAGTLDYVCQLKDGRVALIDFKFSNAIYASYYLQIAAYKKAFEVLTETKIDLCGVLWLKSLTRGKSKEKGKIQGEGWQLKEPEKDIEHYFNLFRHTQALYLEEHENEKPKTYSLEKIIKL